jgi:cytochrome c-type biogenesis protein CcmF
LWSRLRPLAGSGLVARFRSLPLGYLGMLTAHVGVATFIVGVTLVKSYEAEKDVQMDIGDTVTMGPYTFQFGGVSNGSSENYIYSRGLFEVTRNGQVVGTMRPEKRQFLSQQQGEPSTVAAINRGLTRDLYVALGEPAGNNSSAWIVRVYYKPFVDWVWGGCLVMALGGVLALSDRRYRLARRAGQEAVDATLSGTVPA